MVEEIRRKIREMKKSEWKETLFWFKANTSVMGKEVADILKKRSAKNKNITNSCNKIKKSVIMKDV